MCSKSDTTAAAAVSDGWIRWMSIVKMGEIYGMLPFFVSSMKGERDQSLN